jgi:hypothetical protein
MYRDIFTPLKRGYHGQNLAQEKEDHPYLPAVVEYLAATYEKRQ